MKEADAISWEGSSDFVFAYRAQKITISRRTGEPAHEDYTKGTMLDGGKRESKTEDGMNFILSGFEEEELSGQGFDIENTNEREVCIWYNENREL